MRILVLSEVTAFMHGGVPVETARLLRGMSDAGHALAYVGDMPIEETFSIRHFEIGLPVDRSIGVRLWQAIETFRPDIIHIMALSSRGIFYIAPYLKKRAWVVTCHSIPPHERKLSCFHWNETFHYGARSLRFLPNSLAWRWLFRHDIVPHVVVHSTWMEKIVLHYGQAKTRTSTIPLGSDATQTVASSLSSPRPARRLRLVTIGGIAHSKGYHDALAAIAELRWSFPDLEYDIVGEIRDPSYLHFLKKTVKRFGLESSVRFLLNATNVEKDNALRRADVYLQPSHEEGFCLAFIEAAGIVPLLVGTDTGAIGSVGAGDSGIRIVPAKRPSCLVEAIHELCLTAVPADTLSSRRAKLADQFSWSKYICAHQLLYERLLKV